MSDETKAPEWWEKLFEHLPHRPLRLLLDFAINKKTGSVSLNFNEGKLASFDVKSHERP